MLLEANREISLDELRNEWRKYKPDSVESITSFLSGLGYDKAEIKKIFQKSGVKDAVARFARHDAITVIADVAKEADLIPQTLRYLQTLGVKTPLGESVDNLTKNEIRAILSTLLDLSDRYTPDDELIKYESIKYRCADTYRTLIINEMQNRVEGVLTEQEYKTHCITMLEHDLTWGDIGLKESVVDNGIRLVEASSFNQRKIIETLLKLTR